MNRNELNDFLQKGLAEEVFPCYAAATGEWTSFGGHRALFPQKETLTEDTLFDMASLSKLIGTTCAALKLIEQGSSYKFCLLAEGTIDYYVRTTNTYEWDTAAGELILAEAGGSTISYPEGKPLCYNKEDLKNPWFEARSATCKL